MDMAKNWRYYNHAFLPSCSPHEEVDTTAVKDGSLWKQQKGAYFARWITDFDCGRETNWWYIIKDTPFDINALKSKRRYEINKGNKYFYVKIINVSEYENEIFDVAKAAFAVYPKKYRPNIEKESFIFTLPKDEDGVLAYGAFERETNKLCGYAFLKENIGVCHFNVLKTMPCYEKYAINAAIVNQILLDYQEKLANGNFYICDGERSVVHETAFQDYLEKYFAFRKAHCTLNIKYRPGLGIIVKILYFFRRLLERLDGINMVHKMNALIKMEDIIRMQKK